MAQDIQTSPGRGSNEKGLSQARDPFQLFHNEIDRLIHDFMPQMDLGFGTSVKVDQRRPFMTAVDLLETDDALELTADLPGVNQKDIEVKLQDGALTIKAEREVKKDVKEGRFHRMERGYGSFFRTYALPVQVQADKVDARFKDGVLSVRIPKMKAAKSSERKVEIKG